MVYLRLSDKVYLYAKSGDETPAVVSQELGFRSEIDAYAALINSEANGFLIERAAIILNELLENDKGWSPKEIVDTAEEWLELLAAHKSAEKLLKKRLRDQLNEANNPLPGANLEYYEHLATLSDAK